MIDFQLAEAFFKRLQERGFKIYFKHDAYGHIATLDEPHKVVIQVLNMEDSSCCEFDFHADGSFYRCAGFTSGHWQDEVDGNKYYVFQSK